MDARPEWFDSAARPVPALGWRGTLAQVPRRAHHEHPRAPAQQQSRREQRRPAAVAQEPVPAPLDELGDDPTLG
ncbi:hypothetical protein tb265_06650 [Gemmatimonadetes bacterium T265]|nr:hypothetical protein tb265_06650 [Gemmatimonadetes bacterium T265]